MSSKYMMDASDFNMHDVVAELDKLPDWVGGNIEEYFPRESMEVNEAGEIIITLRHGNSKVLITPDHSLHARLKAILDSGAGVCIFNQRKFFRLHGTSDEDSYSEVPTKEPHLSTACV
jgi:hypothetical protein